MEYGNEYEYGNDCSSLIANLFTFFRSGVIKRNLKLSYVGNYTILYQQIQISAKHNSRQSAFVNRTYK